ncbi:uncharacterized protein METZ01_LOCUS45135 [marine metagenome]|uniref:Uncharacterized protein n=1 Tax=marine metagenome TaxID=408172 RepID=A0A381RLY8_9ZZZZ
MPMRFLKMFVRETIILVQLPSTKKYLYVSID